MKGNSYFKLRNMKNRLMRIKSVGVLNGYKISIVKLYGKKAFLIRNLTNDNYKVYMVLNKFQAAHDILNKSVHTIDGIVI